MDRNREARRGSMAAAAVNGSSGLSRRRQRRTSNLRDSTDEDGGMEMLETSRLRDRAVKKDRDRDRERSNSRSKRRRGDRLMHESSNRGEGDDSSEESMDEEDGDEDDEVGVRLPLQGNSSNFPPSTSSQQHSHNHHSQNLNHFRKSSSFLGSNTNINKPVRPSAQLMKVSEEMIGVSIPRKARSSMKRPQEFNGTGEPIHHRQDSASPARHSPSSNTATSPPSSNLSIRKKKSITGSKHRPPKMAKSPPVSSTIQEIEIAEVLFGMTRQAPLPVVDKQETSKAEKDDNPNGLNAEAKSRVSSPNSVSQTQASSQQQSVLPMKASAPKRKRPRLRLEEESPTSSVAATSAKIEAEMASKVEEVTSPRSKKNHEESGTVYNEIDSSDPSKDCVDNQKESLKQESGNQVNESKEQEAIKEKVGILGSNFVDKHEEKVVQSGADKSEAVKESPQKAKFSIDLMAPPSIMEKSTSDKDGLSDFSSDPKETGSERKLLPSQDIDKSEKSSKNEGMSDHQNVGNFLSKGFDLKQQQAIKEKLPDLHLNLDKHDKEGLSLGCNGSKQQQQLPFPKQQQKPVRVDHKQDKQAPPASMPLPVPIAGWPSGFPSFGYMGQVPPLQAVVPLDGSSLATNTIQPPNFIQPQQPLKRCATHCYIARNIHSHQQFARMTNPFWAAAAAVGASGTPLYGAKYNLNAVPPSESTAAILGNPLQAGFPPVSLGTLQEKPIPKEMSSTNAPALTNSNLYLDAASAQRKQFLLQQSSQPGSSATPPTMIPGPTIIFPINQQSAVANQPGPASKSTPGASVITATSSPATAANIAPSTSVSFNYAGMNPNDARCMAFMQGNAILQNNAYPFPMAAAAQAGGSPTPYKGANPAQAMPFFNGPFYSPQMVPSQQQMQHHMLQQMQRQHMQQQQQQQQESSSAARQPRNNSSTSSGSSSSQKHTQQTQQRVVPGPGIATGVSNTSHSFQTSLKHHPMNLMSRQARQLENETAREGSPSSTGDNIRLSQQAQKSGGLYGQSFAMPKMPSQNFALISPATAAAGMTSSGSNRNDKQQQQNQQHTLKELTPSQVYAMSFASFGGPTTAAGPSFDFSNIVQNPALLQNLPEVARHGYQIPAAAATQQKKTQHEDTKSVGDSGTSNKATSTTDEAKIVPNASKQQSLNFSRPDNDHAMTNIITNLADASSRPSTIASRAINTPSYSTAAPPTAAAAANPSGFNMSPKSQQQYYQHVMEAQRQQQQQRMQLFQQQQQQQQQQKLPASNRQNAKPGSSQMPAPNNSSSSVNNATSMTPSRFPPLSVLQQGSASSGASHSPQWKSSTPNNNNRQSMTPIVSSSSNSSSTKNQMLQQQQQTQQISFGGVGLSSNKPATNQSATPMNIGSPQSSISKSSAAAVAAGGGSNSGSPRAAGVSSDSKPVPSPSIQHQQQMIAAAAAAKHSQTAAASSNLKPSSPITTSNNNSSNRNLNSMLGHPQMSSAASNNTKNSNSKVHPLQQQQKQQQLMQKQQQQNFQPPQIFFNSTSPYIQQVQQNSQSNAKNNPTASGMLSLSSSLILAGGSSAAAAAASDPAKAAAVASNNKGTASAQQQHQAAQYAAATAAAATSMAPHPFMPSYPYMHAMQSSSNSSKTVTTTTEKKQQQPTTGQGENVHASWKPEKR